MPRFPVNCFDTPENYVTDNQFVKVRHYGPGIKPTESSVPFRLSGDAKNVVLETVKRGEDDDPHSHNKTIVLRLYERLGGHAKTKLLL
jgi:alpha-mannosidase